MGAYCVSNTPNDPMSSPVSLKRKISEIVSDPETTSDDTWSPDDSGEDEDDDDGSGVRTRSHGPAETVSAEALDQIDEVVDPESDFSSSTEDVDEVLFLIILNYFFICTV